MCSSEYISVFMPNFIFIIYSLFLIMDSQNVYTSVPTSVGLQQSAPLLETEALSPTETLSHWMPCPSGLRQPWNHIMAMN